MRANAKLSMFLSALFMVLILDTAMTFTMTTILTGWTQGFVQRLAGGWLLGFIVALPTSIVANPLVRRIVRKLTTQ